MQNKEEFIAATDAAKKAIREPLKTLSETGKSLSRYVFTSPEGKVTHKGQDICFANLFGKKSEYKKWSQGGGLFGVSFLGSVNSGKAVYSDDTLLWLKFVCSEESPWRQIRPHLVTLDPEEIQKDGGFLFQDLEHMDGRLMFSFVSVARHPGENRDKFKKFRELVEKGANPTAAYIMGSFLGREGPYGKVASFWCHESLDMECINDSTENLFKGTPTLDNPFYEKGFKEYELMTRMFKGGGNPLFRQHWNSIGNGPFPVEQVLILCKMIDPKYKDYLEFLKKEFDSFVGEPPKAHKVKQSLAFVGEDKDRKVQNLLDEFGIAEAVDDDDYIPADDEHIYDDPEEDEDDEDNNDDCMYEDMRDEEEAA